MGQKINFKNVESSTLRENNSREHIKLKMD